MTTVQNFNLVDFANRIQEGQRANQFQVSLTLPAALQGNVAGGTEMENVIRFYAKGATLPQETIGEAIVPFRGRQFKLAGDRVFEDWTITVIHDTDQLIRNVVEQWSDWIDGKVNHDQIGDGNSPSNYMGTAEVLLLNKNGDVLKESRQMMIWPKVIGPVELAWDTNDTVAEFTIDFAVNWIETDVTRNNTQQ